MTIDGLYVIENDGNGTIYDEITEKFDILQPLKQMMWPLFKNKLSLVSLKQYFGHKKDKNRTYK